MRQARYTYVPFLKAKAGEFDALRNLAAETRQRISPFLDIVPDKDKAVSQQFIDLPKKLGLACGTDLPFFVDTMRLNSVSDGQRANFYANLLEQNLKIIPVTGLDRDNGRALIAIAKKTGIGVRITKASLITEDAKTLLGSIEKFAIDTSLERSAIHLLIDLESLLADSSETLKSIVVDLLKEIAPSNGWGSLVIAASSFPLTMSGLPADDLSLVPRTDFQLWKQVHAQVKSLGIAPAFGDYGVVSPHFSSEIDFAKANMSAKIRYTATNSWLVCKGRTVKKKNGYDQFHNLARKIATHRAFSGEDFSWADKKISDCANHKTGKGGMRTWVAIDTNHHITFVSNQISNLVGS